MRKQYALSSCNVQSATTLAWAAAARSAAFKASLCLAEQEGVTDANVCRLLPLDCLAPDLVEAILDGRQPKGRRG